MDGQRLHWSTEPFCAAYSALDANSNNISSPFVERVLTPISDDLRALLAAPAKSEASRQTLGKRIVQIAGREVELNNAFVNNAVRVADELNVDELVAAQLVFYASEDSKRLGVDVVESAISLFFVRRQYIIDMVRFALETLPQDEFPLVIGTARGAEHIFLALKAVEQSLEDLSEKSKASHFMGFDKDPQFRQLVELQREFLVKEHQALGAAFNAYFQAAGAQENDGTIAVAVLKHVGTFQSFDSRMLAYLPGIVAWFSVAHTKAFIETLQKYFSGATSQEWTLRYWQAALALIFYTFLSDEELYPEASVSYDSILKAVRHAVDNGALEFLMALAQDIRGQKGSAYLDKYRTLVRSRVPPIQSWIQEPSGLTAQNLQDAFETIVASFITNLADILKEMKLSEEDMYLAMSEVEEDPQAVSPGEDLERFFLFVAATYRDHPGSIDAFFSDPGSALYGFLVWGSECQASFMSTTFTELLSSLASGGENSASVHKFLLDAAKRKSENDDGFLLSWSSIYDVVDYYIRELTTPQSGFSSTVNVNPNVQNGAQVVVPSVMSLPPTQSLPGSQARLSTLLPTTSPTAGSNVAPLPYGAPGTGAALTSTVQWGTPEVIPASYPAASQSQLSDDTLLVLSAYLSLVSRVAGQCAEARDYARGASSGTEEPRDLVPLLFKLLRLQQSLSTSIFESLVPFAGPELWPQLDSYMIGRFEELLTSLPEVLSFVKLLESLAADKSDAPGNHAVYVEFVVQHVLVWSANVKERTNLHVLLLFHCLKFLKELLESSPKSAVTTKSEATTKSAAFEACFDSKVYGALFNVVSTGVDGVISLSPEHPLVKAITLAVQIVALLLKESVPPQWSFNRPVLYNLHIIPHLALYAGTRFEELSLASIEVLSILEHTAEFRPTITRQSRILSIVSSTSEATRIRVGLMARIQDSFTPPTVKAALLELLVEELAQRDSPRPVMTAAHYLLGFRQSDLGLELKLELDKGVGGIASGTSMFGVICDLLLNILSGDAQGTRLLKLSSEILGHLTSDALTSEMVLDYLRPLQFVLTTIAQEPVYPDLANFEDFYQHRAIILDIWRTEIATCQQKVFLTLENHYLESLEPSVFTLLDSMRFPRVPVTLRCLESWSKLIPVLIASRNPLMGVNFVLRAIQTLIPLLPVFAREAPAFAQPIASLLATLLVRYENAGVDTVVVSKMHPLLEASLGAIQPSRLNADLRADLYSLCFNHLRMVLRTQSQELMGKTLQAIVSSGPRLTEVVCDDALGAPSEPLRLGSLGLLQVIAVLSRNLNSEWITEMFVHYNLNSLLVSQLLPTVNGCTDDKSGRVVKISLSFLLQLAQSRAGAFDILHTKLFEFLDKDVQIMKGDLLLLVTQLLSALVISVGVDNPTVTSKVNGLLEKHRSVFEQILLRDNQSSLTLKDDSETVSSRLSKTIVALFDLTGMSPPLVH